MVLTYRQINEGMMIPNGWGVAWSRPEMRAEVILPIPVNIIAGLIHRWYWCIVRGVSPGLVEQFMTDANHQGWVQGRESGEAAGRAIGFQEGREKGREEGAAELAECINGLYRKTLEDSLKS